MYQPFPRAELRSGRKVKNAVQLRFIAATRLRLRLGHSVIAVTEPVEVPIDSSGCNWDFSPMGPLHEQSAIREVINEMRQEFFLVPLIRQSPASTAD